jgi:hypothetical protein
MHTHTRTRTHTCKNPYIHTFLQQEIYTYMHTHTHNKAWTCQYLASPLTHTHTHTQAAVKKQARTSQYLTSPHTHTHIQAAMKKQGLDVSVSGITSQIVTEDGTIQPPSTSPTSLLEHMNSLTVLIIFAIALGAVLVLGLFVFFIVVCMRRQRHRNKVVPDSSSSATGQICPRGNNEVRECMCIYIYMRIHICIYIYTPL